MITGITKSGFKFKVDEKVLTDWRFTTALIKTQKGSDMEKLEGASDMVNMVFGSDGEKKLIEHICKKNGGMCPSEKVMEELTEIISSSPQTKN